MTETVPRLSIAVPTFDGARTIARTLGTILPQLRDDVEVVVCDNASADDTGDILAGPAAGEPRLRYFRNEANLGYDRNVDLAVRRARAPFVWLFTDDDVMFPGAVDTVLAALDRHPEIGFLYAGAVYERGRAAAARLGEVVDDGPGWLCRSGDAFFAVTDFDNGGLSSNVVNKSLWEATDLSAHMDSGWVHVAYAIAALQQAPGYAVKETLKEEIPLAAAKRWSEGGAFFRVGLRIARLYKSMPKLGYRDETVKRALTKVKGRYWFYIPYARALGLRPSLEIVKECVALYKGFPSFWIVDLPLLFVPRFLYRLIYHAWRARKRFGAAYATPV